MSVNKHIVTKEWVEQFLLGNKMYFDNIEAYQGARSIIPDYGDFVISTDIVGNKRKWYSFGFVATEPLDTTDNDINNATSRQLVDDFNDWLVEQETNKNYPDFGDKVTKYKIVPLYNTANMAQVFAENGMAKYILMARIEYTEKE